MSGTRYSEWPLEEEILRFVTDQTSYSARTRSGMELRILKAQTFQPPVQDEDNFATFLWIETVEGFFLLRQHLVYSQALPWYLLRRLIPAPGQPHFFHEFQEELESYIEAQGLNIPYDLDEDIPGFIRLRSLAEG